MGKKSKEERNADKLPKESTSSGTNYKYYFFLFIFLFPSLAWIISVAGDTFNNIGGVFGSIANGLLISSPVIVPILISIYSKSKKLRGLMLKGVLPVAIAVLIFPSIQVYLCSPIYLKNEDLGTKHSLQATADKFLKDSCIEHCLNPSKIPSAYQLSLFTPRVAIRVYNRQLVDLNLTTSIRTGGKVVKVAKLLLLPSWRKVKGKYHALYILARIPLKVKKLQQVLKDKNDVILTGKVVTFPNDLKKLKSGLEKQRRFVRPVILEVFRITPIEAETVQDKPDEKEATMQEDKRENTTKEETKSKEPPKTQEEVKEEATPEEEINEEDYVPVDEEDEEIVVDE
ncbi:hypothetical protein QZH41_006430 [Actinostola sp. cb2023]|nr:hypothetical protein QZH41_006430 [Actinostola sp. cb2023]